MLNSLAPRNGSIPAGQGKESIGAAGCLRLFGHTTKWRNPRKQHEAKWAAGSSDRSCGEFPGANDTTLATSGTSFGCELGPFAKWPLCSSGSPGLCLPCRLRLPFLVPDLIFRLSACPFCGMACTSRLRHSSPTVALKFAFPAFLLSWFRFCPRRPNFGAVLLCVGLFSNFSSGGNSLLREHACGELQ